MQDLKELVYIVTKNRLKTIEIIGDSSDAPSRVTDFYNALADGKFETDDEAAAFFYEGDKQHSGYQKLRTNLKSRLINSLFFIDGKDTDISERERAYYLSYREWAAAKILFSKNASHAAISICHKLLKAAKRYEFTELAVDITRTLRLHYGTREANIKKFEQYNEQFKWYERVWHMENLAEELYADLTISYIHSRLDKLALHETAREYLSRLGEAPLDPEASYRLYLGASMLEISIYTSINDYENAIEVCKKSIAFFQQKPYAAKIPLQIYYYQLMVCHIQLKKYEAGKEDSEKCLSYLEEGTYNWFKYRELYMLLSLHTSQYQEAYRIFMETIEHPKFKTMASHITEMWKIFEAYVHYLIEIGKIRPKEGEVHFTHFRLGKFLNEVPIFSKDKRGMNIPVLVIQIVLMIQQKKYNEAIDRIESIKKYCSRYLRQDDTFRSNCFIKMLLQIPANSFHRTGVERKTRKLFKRLKEVPLDVANQSHEIEIIPFESMWALVLEQLENRFVRVYPAKKDTKKLLS
ncbi:MAG: hypothetical protein NWS63_07550 [Saprospiraceae bacterium]|jgi:tetratricopeptide (TPR) repeat protein|nr:hypothetical protein [Saprospiraceae bacterium]MDP4999574.1 hypothetical protein [Saprospiraceae bacterium]